MLPAFPLVWMGLLERAGWPKMSRVEVVLRTVGFIPDEVSSARKKSGSQQTLDVLRGVSRWAETFARHGRHRGGTVAPVDPLTAVGMPL